LFLEYWLWRLFWNALYIFLVTSLFDLGKMGKEKKMAIRLFFLFQITFPLQLQHTPKQFCLFLKNVINCHGKYIFTLNRMK
jgi:hypothetical protein